MSATAETLERLHRLTVADYHRMGEAGLFAPGARTELIEGAIVDMTPIGSRHAGTVRHLTTVLHRVLQDNLIISDQAPLILESLSEPQPDIAVLKPSADYYKTRHPGATDVILLVEVSDTSVDFGRHTKLPLYAHHGIPEAWLVDLPAGVLEIHREPEEGAYTRLDRLGPEDLAAVPLPGIPDTTIDLTGLL
ncbi:MAG: Uma2 family endonuclease [Gammaproteobacteria bacterium]|nr:Uma2 family endonuclease [Gammaproteobacteria bacterium]